MEHLQELVRGFILSILTVNVMLHMDARRRCLIRPSATARRGHVVSPRRVL